MKYTETKKSTNVIILYSVSIISRIAAFLTVITFFLCFMPLVITYVQNATSYDYLRIAYTVEQSIESFVRSMVPTVIGGKDRSAWIIAVSMLIFNGFFSHMSQSYRSKAVYLRLQLNYEAMKAQLHISDDSKILSPLKLKLQQASTGKKKDRQELLNIFAETKKKLDSIGKDLAFLSIDVVDSTGMKQGEDRIAIEHTFREYKSFVESMFILHSYMKAAWTPDGVMACFKSTDDAVKAARDIITGLDDFNKHAKTMKRDFVVRCGINSGFVYFDDETPMEEMSDRVIDIAGHMQKYAQPSTVAIAKTAIEPLGQREGFEASGRIVDGYEVYEWKKV